MTGWLRLGIWRHWVGGGRRCWLVRRDQWVVARPILGAQAYGTRVEGRSAWCAMVLFAAIEARPVAQGSRVHRKRRARSDDRPPITGVRCVGPLAVILVAWSTPELPGRRREGGSSGPHDAGARNWTGRNAAVPISLVQA